MAGDEVNLRRGFARLVTVLVALWFIYWTCANIVNQPSSENAPVPLGPALSATAEIVLAAAAILGLWWIVTGLRPD